MSASCVICCSDFNGSSIGTCIPCGHCFHEECFDRWEATQHVLEIENEDDDVLSDEGKVTCPMCMQGVSQFQRIFLDVGSSSSKPELQLLSSSSQSCIMDTIKEEDETGMVEDYYQSLYEQTKKELQKVRKECHAMEGRYEEAMINQSRSHQETLDACLEKVEKERKKKEALKDELKALRQERKTELKHLEEKVAEKQKWRNIALEKTRVVSKLQQQLQEKEKRIQKLIGHPLAGTTSISELIVKLNRHRDVEFPYSEEKNC